MLRVAALALAVGVASAALPFEGQRWIGVVETRTLTSRVAPFGRQCAVDTIRASPAVVDLREPGKVTLSVPERDTASAVPNTYSAGWSGTFDWTTVESTGSVVVSYVNGTNGATRPSGCATVSMVTAGGITTLFWIEVRDSANNTACPTTASTTPFCSTTGTSRIVLALMQDTVGWRVPPFPTCEDATAPVRRFLDESSNSTTNGTESGNNSTLPGSGDDGNNSTTNGTESGNNSTLPGSGDNDDTNTTLPDGGNSNSTGNATEPPAPVFVLPDLSDCEGTRSRTAGVACVNALGLVLPDDDCARGGRGVLPAQTETCVDASCAAGRIVDALEAEDFVPEPNANVSGVMLPPQLRGTWTAAMGTRTYRFNNSATDTCSNQITLFFRADVEIADARSDATLLTDAPFPSPQFSIQWNQSGLVSRSGSAQSSLTQNAAGGLAGRITSLFTMDGEAGAARSHVVSVSRAATVAGETTSDLTIMKIMESMDAGPSDLQLQAGSETAWLVLTNATTPEIVTALPVTQNPRCPSVRFGLDYSVLVGQLTRGPVRQRNPPFGSCIFTTSKCERIKPQSSCVNAKDEDIDRVFCAGIPVIPQEREDCSGCINWVVVGNWTECDRPCGGGFQERTVHCVDQDGRQLGSNLCTEPLAGPKPETLRGCNDQSCSNGGTDGSSSVCGIENTQQWVNGTWSPCSAPCGLGTQTRTVSCQDGTGRTVLESCCPIHTRPPLEQQCQTCQCESETLEVRPTLSLPPHMRDEVPRTFGALSVPFVNVTADEFCPEGFTLLRRSQWLCHSAARREAICASLRTTVGNLDVPVVFRVEDAANTPALPATARLAREGRFRDSEPDMIRFRSDASCNFAPLGAENAFVAPNRQAAVGLCRTITA